MIPEIIARAVELGLWKPQRALEVAIQSSDPIPRGKLFALLLDSGMLDMEQHAHATPQAFAAIRELSDQNDQAMLGQLLGVVIPHLPDANLEEAFRLTVTIHWPADRRPAMSALAPRLNSDLWQGILSHIQSLPPYKPMKPCQFDMIKRLATDFPDTLIQQVWTIFQEATLVASKSTPDYHIANTLQALIPRLHDEHIEQAFQITMGFSEGHGYYNHQADSLAILAPRLSGKLLDTVIDFARDHEGKHGAMKALILSGVLDQRVDLLNEAFAFLVEAEQSRMWVNALRQLAPHLTSKKLVRLFKSVKLLPTYLRIDGLVILMPRLEEPYKRKATDLMIDTLPQIRAGDPDSIDEEYQVVAMRKVAPFLHGQFIDKAFEFVMTVKSNRERCYMLIELAKQTTEKQQRWLFLANALEAATDFPPTLVTHTVGDQSALIALAPHLSGLLLDQAYDHLTAPLEENGTLKSFAQFPSLVDKISRTVLSKNNSALAALAPKLSAEQVMGLLQ